MEYNLEERTLEFSESVVDLIKSIKINLFNKSIINQLLRSATSIGANYYEANGAISKKDFRNKIHICKKEAKETMYWLRLLIKVSPEIADRTKILWKEAHELTLIFSKITSTLNKPNSKE